MALRLSKVYSFLLAYSSFMIYQVRINGTKQKDITYTIHLYFDDGLSLRNIPKALSSLFTKEVIYCNKRLDSKI